MTEPTEMEDRVARAIAVADGVPSDYLTMARAAIGAMREPTQSMLDAGEIVELTRPGLRGASIQIADSQRERRWKQMVDAASPRIITPTPFRLRPEKEIPPRRKALAKPE